MSIRSTIDPGMPAKNASLMVFAVLAGILFLSGAAATAGSLSWGREPERWQDVPAAQEWLDVALGGHHTVALTPGGTVCAWGENFYGQCSAPGTNDFSAVAAGLYHSLALRCDGSIAAWGDNTKGQCQPPTTQEFVAIGVGDWHCLAIRADGSVVAWGWNEYGQCNAPAGGRYVAVSGGHGHSLALTSEGELMAWGSNADGQCNVPEGKDFVAIAAGALHCVALRSDGSVTAWGHHDYGQCDGPKSEDFTAIAAGAFHSLALRRDGSVLAWGHNDYGQCNIPADGRLAAIAAGGYQSFGVAAKPAGTNPVEQYDLRPVFNAIARIARQAISEVDTALLCITEGNDGIPISVRGPIEMVASTDSIPTVPEVTVLDYDETTSPELEVSLDQVPINPTRAAVPVTEALFSTMAGNTEILTGNRTPVKALIAKVSLLYAGYASLGLAGATLVFSLLRRAIRKWREQRKQLEEMQKEPLWTLLLESDQRSLFSELDDR